MKDIKYFNEKLELRVTRKLIMFYPLTDNKDITDYQEIKEIIYNNCMNCYDDKMTNYNNTFKIIQDISSLYFYYRHFLDKKYNSIGFDFIEYPINDMTKYLFDDNTLNDDKRDYLMSIEKKYGFSVVSNIKRLLEKTYNHKYRYDSRTQLILKLYKNDTNNIKKIVLDYIVENM